MLKDKTENPRSLIQRSQHHVIYLNTFAPEKKKKKVARKIRRPIAPFWSEDFDQPALAMKTLRKQQQKRSQGQC